jgi:hypothetical protein
VNLKGPDLKLPDLSRLRAKLPGGSRSGKNAAAGAGGAGVKAPDFLLDIYYDLRERRLLPVVALVVVAILAVPFLLGRDSEAPELPPPSSGALGAPSAADGARLTVVESTPGLRDYRKRLHGTPTDPFIQKYTGVPATSQLKSTGEGEGGEGVSGGGESAISPEAPSSTGGGESSTGGSGDSGGAPPSTGGGDGGGSGGGNGGSKAPPLIEFVFDVQVSRSETTADGKQKMSEPQVRRRVRSLTQLPGEKAPVVTMGGLNLRNGKVSFLVSNDVGSLEGDFTCLTRPPNGLCELLEIEPGFPLEAIYGANKVRYRFKVTKIDAVPAGHVGDERKTQSTFQGPVAVQPPVP